MSTTRQKMKKIVRILGKIVRIIDTIVKNSIKFKINSKLSSRELSVPFLCTVFRTDSENGNERFEFEICFFLIFDSFFTNSIFIPEQPFGSWLVSDDPYFSLKLDFREVRPILELGKPTLLEKQGVRLPTNLRNAVKESQTLIKNEHEN